MSDGFFIADIEPDVTVGQLVTVTGPEARHAVTVRRIAAGEIVTLSNGNGLGVRGPVTASGREQMQVQVDEVLHAAVPRPAFTVIQALPKLDRAEQAVDLLTQVGVSQIVPWQASRSIARWHGERAEKSRQRWQTVARETSKQCRRLQFPEVTPVVTTDQAAAMLDDTAYVLHEAATTSVGTITPTASQITVVVGPEGGLTDDEVAQFVATGATAILIGDTVLRAATAGAVAVVQLRLLAQLARR